VAPAILAPSAVEVPGRVVGAALVVVGPGVVAPLRAEVAVGEEVEPAAPAGWITALRWVVEQPAAISNAADHR